MQTEQIEPCLYCGEKCHTDYSHQSGEGREKRTYTVYCPCCLYRSALRNTKVEAISAHNTLCRSVRENGVLREAVEYVANPMKAMRAEAEKIGAVLNQYAPLLAKDADHLSDICRKALEQITNKGTP